jgi:hypothetical protein
MAEFLVEVYVRHDDLLSARSHTERAQQAAADLRREGWGVQCVRSIFVPEDETFLVLFEAPGVEAVAEAVSRAGLRCEHISAAASATPPSIPDADPAGPQPTRKALP